MKPEEIIKTLKIASESEDNIAKKMLMIMAAEMVDDLSNKLWISTRSNAILKDVVEDM